MNLQPRPRLKVAHRFIEMSLPAVRDGDFHAFLGQHLGNAETNAAAAACDEGGLVSQVSHGIVLSAERQGREIINRSMENAMSFPIGSPERDTSSLLLTLHFQLTPHPTPPIT